MIKDCLISIRQSTQIFRVSETGNTKATILIEEDIMKVEFAVDNMIWVNVIQSDERILEKRPKIIQWFATLSITHVIQDIVAFVKLVDDVVVVFGFEIID